QILGAQAATLERTRVAAAVARLEGRGIEGLILALPVDPWQSASEPPATTLPTVTIGGPSGKGSTGLAVDQERVAQLATDHLLDLGHQSVHLVAGPQDWPIRRNARWAGSTVSFGAAGTSRRRSGVTGVRSPVTRPDSSWAGPRL